MSNIAVDTALLNKQPVTLSSPLPKNRWIKVNKPK